MKTLALFGKLVAGTAFALVLAYLFYFGGITAWKITSTQGVSHRPLGSGRSSWRVTSLLETARSS